MLERAAAIVALFLYRIGKFKFTIVIK